jgi:signal transduction histidine kinase
MVGALVCFFIAQSMASADETCTKEAAQAGVSYFNGAGWVNYRWPKPGEKTFSGKTSYIKGCLMGTENVYVGAGIYVQ